MTWCASTSGMPGRVRSGPTFGSCFAPREPSCPERAPADHDEAVGLHDDSGAATSRIHVDAGKARARLDGTRRRLPTPRGPVGCVVLAAAHDHHRPVTEILGVRALLPHHPAALLQRVSAVPEPTG